MLLIQYIVSISDIMITPFIVQLCMLVCQTERGWLICSLNSCNPVDLLSVFQWMSSRGHCCETKILTLCAHLKFHPHASLFALTFQSCFFPTTWPTSQTIGHCSEVHMCLVMSSPKEDDGSALWTRSTSTTVFQSCL